LLGNQAYEGATAKLKELQQEFKAGEKIARGADYPPAEIKLERRVASLYSVDKAVVPKKRRA
jgi:hypothetical protein